jgi:PAS domain S-box-containing protein
MTAEGELEFINPPVKEFFGKSLEEMKEFFGKSVEEMKDWGPIAHPEDKQKTLDGWMHALKAGEPSDEEVRAQRADGVHRWLRAHVVPLKDAQGRVLHWYGLLTDIDDRKRAQEVLRASELTFRSIVETIPGMLYTLTAEGELEFINARITEFFGKSLDQMKEFFGKSVAEMKDWGGHDASGG